MYSKIIIPTKPQTDTVIAVFLLKRFGEDQFRGVKRAVVEQWPALPEGETEDSLAAHGVLLLDIGGGRFDHHNKNEKTTASDLVAEHLGITADPALAKLFAFVRRDDFYGKGIVSNDPLDRAFGFPGLLSNLAKQHLEDPNTAVVAALPFIEAHYEEERQRTEEMPKEFESIAKTGGATMFDVRQGDKNLHVVSLQSDNVSLPGYLRSQLGGRFDVVAQRLSSGHVNILTRPTKRVRLDALAALIRLEEATKTGRELDLTESALRKPGRIPQVPEWYYDPATNSIQNGGVNPKDTPPSHIAKEELEEILKRGLAGKILE